jgi:hypothetical protein
MHELDDDSTVVLLREPVIPAHVEDAAVQVGGQRTNPLGYPLVHVTEQVRTIYPRKRRPRGTDQ